MDLKALREKLAKYEQSHLLDHWDDLSDDQKRALYDELMAFDFAELTEDFDKMAVTSANDASEKLDDHMQPLPADKCGSVLKATDEEKSEYERLSFAAISEGKMAILLLAGGQGSRLGVAYPKGMYDVGLPSKKTLFQMQAERIYKLQQNAAAQTGKSGKIAWYIMTSPSTVKPTKEFFKKNNYFGLAAEDVIVFQQGTLPCFTFSGKIIMASKHEISRAPDGNGGLYRALRNDGILADMGRRGVEFVQLYCVDNILVRVGDPVFTGYCISKKAECANKVVPKGFPEESVGITCLVDGHYQVVEYSEITPSAARLRNEDDSLTYWAANLCIHFFTLDFLRRVCNKHERELVHHIAKKKIAHVGADGSIVKPEKPNGIKMEKFVFDVFRFAENFVVWACVREDEFAPLKNAEGASDFTPTHCRNALYALNQKYVRAAGGKMVDGDTGKECPKMSSPAAVGEKNNNDDDNNNKVVVCEVSPLVSYAGEGLAELVGGKTLPTPVLLNSS